MGVISDLKKLNFHQFRESLLKAVFSRLYGGHFKPEKVSFTKVRRASIPSRGCPRSPPRSAEVRELLYQVAKV
jgi:hypothetical protein